MKVTFLTLLIFLIFLIGIALLQVFLSKTKSKWPGLILPIISLLYSLIMVLSLAIYVGMSIGEIFILIGSTFIFSNIPTVILLTIYYVCREKMKARSQLDKMNIQDLE